ncbi:hypothetical protein D3C86_2248910 [compost metagenome]
MRDNRRLHIRIGTENHLMLVDRYSRLGPPELVDTDIGHNPLYPRFEERLLFIRANLLIDTD